MDARNLNRPSYVVAILLVFIAIVDAGNGLINMQAPGGGDTGFLVDLGACIVSAALVALLLSRPDLNSLGAVFVWSVIAFLANLVLRDSARGLDPVATVRMAVYLIVAVVSGILVAVDYDGRWGAAAAAPASPVPPATPPAPPAPPAG